MIAKERLEELIQQGATIWKVPYGTPIETKLNKNSYVCNDLNLREDYLMEYSTEKWSYTMSGLLSHLFETKEDAEEYAEFGNITRTEKLELPSWEDVSKDFIPLKVASGQYPVVEFGDNSIEIIVNVNKDIQVVLWTDFVGKFVAPLTRENYNEARRLCVKLFKGE